VGAAEEAAVVAATEVAVVTAEAAVELAAVVVDVAMVSGSGSLLNKPRLLAITAAIARIPPPIITLIVLLRVVSFLSDFNKNQIPVYQSRYLILATSAYFPQLMPVVSELQIELHRILIKRPYSDMQTDHLRPVHHIVDSVKYADSTK
jgi:hypothetical protein